MTAGHPAGAAHIQFFRVDSYMRCMGTASTIPPSAGTTTHAYKPEGLVGFNVTNPERVSVNLRSGDKIVGSIMFGANEPVSGTFSTEVIDSLLLNMVEGSNTDETTVDGWYVFGSNDQKPAVNTLGCILTRRWQSRDVGTDGDMLWLNEIYMLQISPTKPAAAYQSVNEAAWAVRAIPFSRWPNGVAFDSTLGLYQNKTSCLSVVAPNPISCTTFIADGTATKFTLQFLPVSDVTTAATRPNFMAINNTETAPSAISTTTGEVTLVSAGTSGDVVIMVYETEFNKA